MIDEAMKGAALVDALGLGQDGGMAAPGVEKIVPAGMGMSRLTILLDEATQAENNLHNNNPALRARGSEPSPGHGSPSASVSGLGPNGAPISGAEGVIAGLNMEGEETPEGEIRFEFTEHELVNEVNGH